MTHCLLATDCPAPPGRGSVAADSAARQVVAHQLAAVPRLDLGGHERTDPVRADQRCRDRVGDGVVAVELAADELELQTFVAAS